MPRKARKDTSGRFFHIIVQGIGKERVFHDDNTKGYYLSCLQKYKELYPVKILGFCILDNHTHVLLSAKDTQELSAYFKRVNSDYAMYYNRLNKRAGYVFRDRFKSEVIESIKYMTNCLAYIHNNPLKAGLVDVSEEYEWSSYSNYIKRTGIVDFDEALTLFDTSSQNIRAIMTELTLWNWLEHGDKEYEDTEVVLKELLEKYKVGLTEVKRNIALSKKIAEEIIERCGANVSNVAEILEIGKETLRYRLSR